MKVLITGATGFLGAALTQRLAQDAEVSIIASGRNQVRGMELQMRHPNVHFSAIDLKDPALIKNACKDIHTVFHCGALSSPWGPRKSFYEANVLGTKNILNGCLKQQVQRLIYISSPSIYKNNDRVSIREDAPFRNKPLNEYIRSKIEAEALVKNEPEVQTITLRPRAIFGAGDQALFPRIIRANRRGRFPLIGSNNPYIDCTYIDNVVDAILLAAKADCQCFGKAYNISNDEPILRSQLLEKLFRYTKQDYQPRTIPAGLACALACILEAGSHLLTTGRYEPVLTRYTVEVLSKSQVLDNSAAQKDLKYSPRISIDEGLQRFGTWWLSQGDTSNKTT